MPIVHKMIGIVQHGRGNGRNRKRTVQRSQPESHCSGPYSQDGFRDAQGGVCIGQWRAEKFHRRPPDSRNPPAGSRMAMDSPQYRGCIMQWGRGVVQKPTDVVQTRPVAVHNTRPDAYSVLPEVQRVLVVSNMRPVMVKEILFHIPPRPFPTLLSCRF